MYSTKETTTKDFDAMMTLSKEEPTAFVNLSQENSSYGYCRAIEVLAGRTGFDLSPIERPVMR
jgi:hypothetical protein